MERLTILAVCLISALAIGTPAVDGQTNAPVVQNGSQGAATGRSHTSNVHPNAPISRNIARGPVKRWPSGDQLAAGPNRRSTGNEFAAELFAIHAAIESYFGGNERSTNRAN
jgi:hypothetical protein